MRQEQWLEIRLVVAQATRLFRPATRRTAGAVIQARWGRSFRDFACSSSGRRVADRGGRVARATHFQNRLLAEISVD